MRLSTWNVNGLRARLEFAELWLKDRAPDVVGMQELKLTDDDFPHDFFANLGYRAFTHGQKSWNGVAVLVRGDELDAEVTQVGLPNGEEMGARLLSVEVDGLHFTTLYCPNGKTVTHDDYQRKLSWYDALADHLAATAPANAIVCGDFNIVPTPLDSWRGDAANGDIFHTEAERERFNKLLNLGYVDLHRQHAPDDQVFSWWDYRGDAFHRKQGLRIDMLLGTAPVVQRLANAYVDRDYRKKQNGLTASDHAPVIVELQ